jgi:predicted nuclease with RNAse H fold
MLEPVGIDPASGKPSCIWKKGGHKHVPPQNMRSYLEDILRNNVQYVIAWDAPISFNESSYSDRAIDKTTRRWVKGKTNVGHFERKAINVLPFSGLSHWVISCKALGLPFGHPLPLTAIPGKQSYLKTKHHQIIEVHPAVSMGLMWVDQNIDPPFPVYKNSENARRVIVEKLSFPIVCVESSDILDAYVAFLMASEFISGKAAYLNNPSDGSYVLPLGESFEELKNML